MAETTKKDKIAAFAAAALEHMDEWVCDNLGDISDIIDDDLAPDGDEDAAYDALEAEVYAEIVRLLTEAPAES